MTLLKPRRNRGGVGRRTVGSPPRKSNDLSRDVSHPSAIGRHAGHPRRALGLKLVGSLSATEKVQVQRAAHLTAGKTLSRGSVGCRQQDTRNVHPSPKRLLEDVRVEHANRVRVHQSGVPEAPIVVPHLRKISFGQAMLPRNRKRHIEVVALDEAMHDFALRQLVMDLVTDRALANTRTPRDQEEIR